MRVERFVEQIFGVDMTALKDRGKDGRKTGERGEKPFASRLEVAETEIENAAPLVQTRVRIDRFTGGAREGALFDAAPVFSSDQTQKTVEICLRLREGRANTRAEIGLLLLLLKDLWTSDLPLGGESSVGRGRLKGISANLTQIQKGEKLFGFDLSQGASGKIEIKGDSPDKNKLPKDFLDDFVKQLLTELRENDARNRENENDMRTD